MTSASERKILMTKSLIVPTASGIIPSFMLREVASRARRASVRNGALRTLGNIEMLRSSFDPRGSASSTAVRETYDAKNTTDEPGTKARFEGDPATGDKVVDEAYDFTGD